MRRIILFVVLSSLFCGRTALATSSSPAPETDSTPRAVFDRTTVAFPPVIAGAVVTQAFGVRNLGKSVLNIPGIYTQ